MKLFWTAILSVVMGFGPIMPQTAFAEPTELSDSCEVLDLGEEGAPLMVLFVNVVEKENVAPIATAVAAAPADVAPASLEVTNVTGV